MQDDLLQSDDMDRIQINFDADGTLYDHNISYEHDNDGTDIMMMDGGGEALGEIYRQVAEEHYRMDNNESGRRRQNQRVNRGERETEETGDGSESRNEECEAHDETMMDDVVYTCFTISINRNHNYCRAQLTSVCVYISPFSAVSISTRHCRRFAVANINSTNASTKTSKKSNG